MKKVLLFILAIVLTFPIAAQERNINGVVLDPSSEPIGYVNVILYNLPDTTYVTGVITNDQGRFELPAAPSADAIIEVSFVGYQTQYAPALEEQTITLTEGGVNIDEVV